LTVKQLGHHGLHPLQGVGEGARLLEDFLLHVVPVGPQFGRAAVGLYRANGALRRRQCLPLGIGQPVAAQLQIHHVAFGQVDDLVGHPSQGHGIAGQVMRSRLIGGG